MADWGAQIKVQYLIRDGNGTTSKAYVDENMLSGTDKYTNVDVELKWDEENQVYVQIDDFEWDFDQWGEPHRRKSE